MSHTPSSSTRTDSQIKESQPISTFYGMPAAKIKQRVAADLQGNVRIVTKTHFLDQILGTEVNTTDALEHIKKKGLYKNNSWVKIPRSKEKETAFYEPLVNIANAVNIYCRDIGRRASGCVNAEWYATPHTAPESRNRDRARIQPDIVYVSNQQLAQKLEKDAKTETGVGGARSTDEGSVDADSPQFLKLWWLQVHTCIEVKTKTESAMDLNEHIIQLCSYLRQMFREQLDRRFVLGLLLCGSHLTMWLCDRSGLIGTVDPINIHQEPEDFIKVLSAFSVLPAHRLGWDPTMGIYHPNEEDPARAIPSYEIYSDPGLEHFEKNLYRINWVISMPIQGSLQHEQFVTLRAIVTISSERICSRATVVWEVCRLNDIINNVKNPKIYVLKQSWQPIEMNNIPNGEITFNEAAMYSDAGMGNRILSSTIVQNPDPTRPSKEPVDTTYSIRHQNIGEVYSKMKRAHPQTGNRRDVEEEPFLYMELDSCASSDRCIFDKSFEASPVFVRALTRLVLEGTGYPVTRFSDLIELIQVFIDCITDHKAVYEKHILHRDVSIGNMIILIPEGNEMEDAPVGRLIDFDHAKKTGDKIKLHDHGLPSTIERLASWQQEFGFQVQEGIFNHAWRYFGNPGATFDYIRDLWFNIPSLLKGLGPGTFELTMDNLAWPSESELITSVPDFSTRLAREGFQRTGTIPFVGTEVLLDSLCCPPPPHPSVPDHENRYDYFHDAVHDMESFLWALVYICSTQQDPHIRLYASAPQDHQNEYILKLFHPASVDALCRSRCEYILNIDKFSTKILPSFKEYFKPLEMLVLRWFWTLKNAYKYRAIEYHHIHDIILRLLKTELKKLQETHTRSASERQAIKRRLYDDWVKQRQWPKNFNTNDRQKQLKQELPSRKRRASPENKATPNSKRLKPTNLSTHHAENRE